MLWSTLQGITRAGKGVELAPLATGQYEGQLRTAKAIRDAGGKAGAHDLAEVLIVSNRGVLFHTRCPERAEDAKAKAKK
jgi:hypothetical protein